ncbi:hypothetical protein ABPG72_017271 [Tetrahymena utriculariae]
MPKVGGRRKKTRTHKEEGPEGDEIIGKVPKSLIFRRGKLNKPLKQIVQDYREIMYPYTAMKLKETDKAKIKDYLSASKVYGMTHLTILTSTENHNYIRFIKNPEGPTITFKIISYCTRRDVQTASKRNKAFSRQFQPAMLILNGFNKQATASVRNPPTLPQQQIVAQMIQSMFPPLSLKNTKADNLQRVILFSYDNEKDIVNMRHYHIQLVPTGVNKNVKKIIKQDKKTPNLSKFNSFADFIQNKKAVGGFASESDADELPDSKIDIQQKSYISGKDSFKKQYNIKLHEIGPRLKLRLYKIEEGLLRGNVVYNRRVLKTAEEVETQRKEILRKELEKEKRRKEMEKILKAKEREQKKKQKEKAERIKQKAEERKQREENGEEIEDEEEEDNQEENKSEIEEEQSEQGELDNEDEGDDFDYDKYDMDFSDEDQKDNKQSKQNTQKKDKTQKKSLTKENFEQDELDSEEELQNLEKELEKIQNKKNKYQYDDEDDYDDEDEDDNDDDQDDEDDDQDDEHDEQIDEDDDVEYDDDEEEEDLEQEEEVSDEEVKEPKLKKKNKKN